MAFTYTFHSPQIMCNSCARSIKNALPNNCATLTLKPIRVDVTSKHIFITVPDDTQFHEKHSRLLQNALNDLGFESKNIKKSHHRLNGFLGTVTGLGLLALSFFMPALPITVMLLIAFASCALTLYLGLPSFIIAVKHLIKPPRRITMETLFTVGACSVMLVSIASFFFPLLPMMFSGGLLIFGFRHIGQAIEESIKEKLDLGMTFQEQVPSTVLKVNDIGRFESCPVAEITIGDILSLKAGDCIPVDSETLSAQATILDTIITGATMPRETQINEALYAGMIAQSAMLIRVTSRAQDSYLARLDKSIEEANASESSIEAVANQLLQYFIPAIFVLSILSGIIIGWFFTPALAIICATSVLVSACPCTLGMIIPLAIKIGMIKAQSVGVQFKTRQGLQTAANMGHIIFDLNGTLTFGEPTVLSFECENGITPDNLLPIIAELESESSHPIGKALRQYAQDITASTMSTVSTVSTVTVNTHERQKEITPLPNGVKGIINSDAYIIGNEACMCEQHIRFPPEFILPNVKPGEFLIYIARNNQLCGYAVLADSIRPGARETIAALQSQGKEVHLCTGADDQTARRYGDYLGIKPNNIVSNAVSLAVNDGRKTKVDYIKSLKNAPTGRKKVAMIGDASNDALALASSDFGIAIQSDASSVITQSQASVVIENKSLFPILHTFEIARQTRRNIRQNLCFSLGYNLVAVLVAGGVLISLGFVLNPAVGVALMFLQTTLLLLNTWRFRTSQVVRTEHMNTAASDTNYNSRSSTYERLAADFVLTNPYHHAMDAQDDPTTGFSDAGGIVDNPNTGHGQDVSTVDRILQAPHRSNYL